MPSEPSARATPPTVPIAMTGGYSLSAPVLHPASDPDDLQEEVSRGETLFAANCASCHGSAGRGDGIASANLLPKPADLTPARFSDERLSSVLWNGVAGSSMPPWRQLPTEDLRALVAYIHSLHPPTAAPSTQEFTALNEGKSLFAANCASCHGDRGAGNGPAAGALAPPPTNFHLKKPTQDRVWEVLENGVPGTAMPPWRSQLSADQRRALVEFVPSLYAPPQENSEQ
jgi:cytochrome c oxidase cbb3-type subunit 2/cytochrome c oxidase cbb3-type subunit I/II